MDKRDRIILLAWRLFFHRRTFRRPQIADTDST